MTVGYLWLIGTCPRPAWCNFLWTRIALPRHRFITWLFLHGRILVKTRLARLYGRQNDVTCGLCEKEEETQDHLFLACPWSQELWRLIAAWWPFPPLGSTYEDFRRNIRRAPGNRRQRRVTHAIIIATVYNIWRARNDHLFKKVLAPLRQSTSSLRRS